MANAEQGSVVAECSNVVGEGQAYTGRKHKALPADSIQAMWAKADHGLKKAAEIYYGRSHSSTRHSTRSNRRSSSSRRRSRSATVASRSEEGRLTTAAPSAIRSSSRGLIDERTTRGPRRRS